MIAQTDFQRLQPRIAFKLMQAMMIEDGHVPPPTMQAYMIALKWWERQTESDRDCWRAIGLEHIRLWWTLYDKWTSEIQSIEPGETEVSWVFEYEHVFLHGGMDCKQWYEKKKGSGPLLSIRLSAAGDPYDPLKTIVEHKPSSPWHRKWKQRDILKSKVPSRLRSTINKSRSMTWKEFQLRCCGGDVVRQAHAYNDPSVPLEYHQEPDERFAAMSATLRRRMNWDLKTLWHHITGRKVAQIRELLPVVQLELF